MNFVVLLVLVIFPLLVQSDAPFVCDPTINREPMINNIDDKRNNVLEELNNGQATIKSVDIPGGTSTDIRNWNNQIGAPCDDAGHLISNYLGGPGNQKWNIWPQNSAMNRGKWSKLEQKIHDKLVSHGSNPGVYAILRVYFKYGDAHRYKNRPTSIYFEYTVQRVKLDRYSRAVVENGKLKILNSYHSEACEMINENDCNNCFDFKRSVNFCKNVQISGSDGLSSQVADFCAPYL